MTSVERNRGPSPTPSAGIAVTWAPRSDPLDAIGAATVGGAARSLAQRILDSTDEVIARLRGVGGQSVLVVLGDAADLPWVDGITYLGRDARAPSLLVPTTLAPDAPLSLVERALRRRFRSETAPFAVLPSEGRVVSCGAAIAIDRNELQRWLERTA